MKREDLKVLELSDEVIDKVMALHGAGIESHKSQLTTAQAEVETLKAQLTEAGATIESFKAMKPDELKAAADEYKVKLEQAQTESASQLAALKFDHALDGALAAAKAKNTKAVQALLSRDALKLNDDGSILGLKEQLEKIKSENDYLFADTKEPPKIVTGGKSQSVLSDPMMDAVRKGAGLVTEEK